MASFYSCRCYHTHNIYIKFYNIHITYKDENQFFTDYSNILKTVGYRADDKDFLIKEIHTEITRRKEISRKCLARKYYIKCHYMALDPNVYLLKEEFFEPCFLKLVEGSKNLDFKKMFQIATQLTPEKQIYIFPVFKPDFCDKFLKELQHFEESDMPKERPNSMNYNGILIDDLGFHDNFSEVLRMSYLDPLAKALFPEWRGQGLDSHKVFTVAYRLGQDVDLGYHYDNSEVTLNVCLGKEFEGGHLYFGDMNSTPTAKSTCIVVPHKLGYGILHRGQQYHAALPIISGERQNLIMWMRSSSIRNQLCPMCHSKPSLEPAVHYGDGFTKPEELMLCTSI